MSALALFLTLPAAGWAERQTQRFEDEEKSVYAAYPEALEAIEAGDAYALTVVDESEPVLPEIYWGGQSIVCDPALAIVTQSGEILPWLIERGTGRIFSEDGTLITGYLYSYESEAIVHASDGLPVQDYYATARGGAEYTVYIPSHGEMYESFFALPALLAAACAAALGFVLALVRRMGLGRGFWGALPVEWHAAAAVVVTAACAEFAGALSLASRGGLAEALRTVFFLGQRESGALALGLVFGVFWLGAFALFEAGASLGMGVRDGFGRYLLCRCWTVRFAAFLVRRARAAVVRLASVDFTQPAGRLAARVLAVNALAMALCCVLWWLGLPAALLYSVCAFFFLRKRLTAMWRQYGEVRAAAARMAEGDLKAPAPALAPDSPFAPLAADLDRVRGGFQRAVDEEVRSQNMKTELITNVSHDLKTPLTAIITYVDLLKDPSLDEKTRGVYIATLEAKSQRLKRLIEDLFEVSKAATGNVTLHCEQVDLAALLRQVRLELADRTQACGVEFRWQLPEESITAWLDGEKTCRALENLIVNITKYSLAGSRAYVSLERVQNEAVFTMKNISAAPLDFDPAAVTERFVRGDQARSTEGSGLGLAIVKSFAEVQGGRFHVETDGDLFKAVLAFPCLQGEGQP